LRDKPLKTLRTKRDLSAPGAAGRKRASRLRPLFFLVAARQTALNVSSEARFFCLVTAGLSAQVGFVPYLFWSLRDKPLKPRDPNEIFPRLEQRDESAQAGFVP
jgi:hypothetical protein